MHYFSSIDCTRFSWFKLLFKISKDFLGSIEAKQGVHTKFEKQKIFISSQTYEALKATVHSVIEVAKFFFIHRVSNMLAEIFCKFIFIPEQT